VTDIVAAEGRRMGIYGERVLPRIINFVGGMKAIELVRRRVCEGLAGDVVEIGFGSGLNIPFYPAAVTRVDAVEPAHLARKLADKRLTATSIPVRRSGLDGQSLPFRGRQLRRRPVHVDAVHYPRCRRRSWRVAPGPSLPGITGTSDGLPSRSRTLLASPRQQASAISAHRWWLPGPQRRRSGFLGTCPAPAPGTAHEELSLVEGAGVDRVRDVYMDARNSAALNSVVACGSPADAAKEDR
jgi:hypothetical protein